jgi:hypothetical protein
MVGFRDFNKTAEAGSAVSIRLHKLPPQFQWDRGSSFGGFIETAEAAIVVSMRMWMRPRNPLKIPSATLFFLRKVVFIIKLCLKKFCFCGLIETAEAYSAVSMRSGTRIQRYQWVHGSGFSGLNETAEAASANSMRPRNPLWHSRIPCKNEFSFQPYSWHCPFKYYMVHHKYMTWQHDNMHFVVAMITWRCCRKGMVACWYRGDNVMMK